MAKLKIERIKYAVISHLQKSKMTFVWVAVFCLLGALVGIILSLGSKSYLELLTTSNKNLLAYVSGTASLSKVFWQRFWSCLWAVVVLFATSLSPYTYFLGYAYLGYQTGTFMLASITLINYQGLSAILNFIILLLPTNLLMLACYALIFSVLVARAKLTKNGSYTFARSFSADFFWLKFAICLICLLAVIIVTNIVIPLIIKGVYVINY